MTLTLELACGQNDRNTNDCRFFVLLILCFTSLVRKIVWWQSFAIPTMVVFSNIYIHSNKAGIEINGFPCMVSSFCWGHKDRLLLA